MNKKIKSNYLLAVLIVISIAIVTACFSGNRLMGVKAYAANEEFQFYQGKYDDYTDTDTFKFNGVDYSITSYNEIPALNCGNAYFTKEGTQGDTYRLSVSEDNAIIKIVPKELFTHTGDFLYIGKEYGFFVNTVPYYNEGNKKSTVLVFDIDTINTNLETNAGIIEVRTMPLFQTEFVYLSSTSTKYYFRNAGNGSNAGFARYSILAGKGYVIRHAENHVDGYRFQIKYDYTVSEYYLKDISYAMTLLNEQDPNEGYGTEHYDPYRDTGSYFTYFDYRYQGTSRQNGSFPVEETVDLATTAVQVGLSLGKAAVQSIPGVGLVLSGIDLAIDIINGVQTIGHFSVGMENYLNAQDVSISNGTITASNYYANRDDQIEHYGSLVKTAAAIINTSAQGNSIWYKAGDHATGYFKVGHGALNGQHKNYTRLDRQIALKVVRKNETVVAAEYSGYHYMLRSPMYKQISMEEERHVYLLEEGVNYFSFNPQFTSDYEITLQTGQNIGMRINGSDVTPLLNASDGKQKLNFRFYGGEAYLIEFRAIGAGCIAPFYINPKENAVSGNLEGGDEYLLKFNVTQTEGKHLSVSKPSAQIKNIFIRDDQNRLVPYEKVVNFQQSNGIDVILNADIDYYALVTSAQTLTGVSLAFSDLETVTLDQVAAVNVSSDNYRYFKFDNTSDDRWYTITLADDNNSSPGTVWFRLYDKDGLEIQGYTIDSGCLQVVLSNGVNYIGILAETFCSVNMVIKFSQTAFEWEIHRLENGNEYFVRKDPSKELNVQALQTAQYRVALWINESLKTERYYIVKDGFENESSSYLFNEDTGVLTIYNRFSVGEEILVEGEAIDNPHATYKHRLKFVGAIIFEEFEVSKSVNYINKMEFSWTPQAHISQYKFKVTGISADGKAINKTEFGSANKSSIDLQAFLIEQKAINNIQVELIAIIVAGVEYSIPHEHVICNDKNLTVELNCMYARYYTYKPLWITYHYYYISNALQFNNIRYNSNYVRRLDNDIDLSLYTSGGRNWTPIPALACSIWGNSFAITNFRYHIGSGTPSITDIGLFGQINKNISILDLKVKDIKITSVTGQHVSTWVNVGGIAGVNNGNIFNSEVTGSIEVHRSSANVGGIVGRNYNLISDSKFGSASAARSLIYSNGDMGGIAGFSSGYMAQCSVEKADISSYAVVASRSVGGIVGYCAQGRLRSCTVTNITVKNVNPAASVTSLYPKMGLIVGHLDNGKLEKVGFTNSTWSYGGLTTATKIYCFNGDWPFYGKIDNSQIDNNLNVNGP